MSHPRLTQRVWPIDDEASVAIVRDTYSVLRDQGAQGAAAALHHATRRARSLHPTQPSLWAAHIHIGP
ncbi:CHAT domain-containing protein [Parafrankia sp. FMc6]|uniref:CHAT domain-containing protein n=1 Tax=Parafrankia soli TaxID=2599596 RepID=UPI0034D5B807